MHLVRCRILLVERWPAGVVGLYRVRGRAVLDAARRDIVDCVYLVLCRILLVERWSTGVVWMYRVRGRAVLYASRRDIVDCVHLVRRRNLLVAGVVRLCTMRSWAVFDFLWCFQYVDAFSYYFKHYYSRSGFYVL